MLKDWATQLSAGARLDTMKAGLSDEEVKRQMSTPGTWPSDSLFEPGAQVRVHSLQSAAHSRRNGTCGRLGEFIPESGRWAVQFEGDDRPGLAVRPANLEFVAAAPARRPGWEEEDDYEDDEDEDEEAEEDDEEDDEEEDDEFEWPVQVHPLDDLKELCPSVFKDPRNFVPVTGPEGVVVR